MRPWTNWKKETGYVPRLCESTYQIPWDAASNFDIVINTGKTSLDSAASWRG